MPYQSKVIPALVITEDADYLDLRHPPTSPLAGKLVFKDDLIELIDIVSQERRADLVRILEAE